MTNHINPLQADTAIYLAGHRGMVGAAILRKLQEKGCTNIITRTRSELDLGDQTAVGDFFAENHIDYVILAAAKVGGIQANIACPADFIYQNLMIEANVIHAAWRTGVQRLLFLGSSCIYPKHTRQPMAESALLTGRLEPTNEPYAIAKIAGIKLCESYNRQYGTHYRSAMPTNLYGPNDNFHAEHSHVIPALMRRIHEARVQGASAVTIWGTGKARREFLHVDDMADAIVYIMALPDDIYEQNTEPMLSHINVGSGKDITIRELAEILCEVIGYHGSLKFDTTQPDGTPQKLLDVSVLEKLGWQAKTGLQDGLRLTYDWFLANETRLRT
ncbi:MAG: GDP-L-fucose synthase [Proteobacteria bacterium]|jgi:GDP-L-fucose synthase|nr:GDP-L-fucose synthase [Pseudomonadota bacterium]